MKSKIRLSASLHAILHTIWAIAGAALPVFIVMAVVEPPRSGDREQMLYAAVVCGAALIGVCIASLLFRSAHSASQ